MSTNTKAVTLLVGDAAISKAIASIQKRGAALDASIQLAGVSILAHIDKHHNVTLLSDLWAALPKGARKNAFAEWAMACGKVVVNEGQDRKTKPFLYADAKVTHLELAWEKPWYDYKPDVDLILAFDVQAAVAKILKQVTAARKANPDVVIRGVELLDSLTTMSTQAVALAEPVDALVANPIEALV